MGQLLANSMWGLPSTNYETHRGGNSFTISISREETGLPTGLGMTTGRGSTILSKIFPLARNHQFTHSGFSSTNYETHRGNSFTISISREETADGCRGEYFSKKIYLCTNPKNGSAQESGYVCMLDSTIYAWIQQSTESKNESKNLTSAIPVPFLIGCKNREFTADPTDRSLTRGPTWGKVSRSLVD